MASRLLPAIRVSSAVSRRRGTHIARYHDYVRVASSGLHLWFAALLVC